jgi:hypothetical protein
MKEHKRKTLFATLSNEIDCSTHTEYFMQIPLTK